MEFNKAEDVKILAEKINKKFKLSLNLDKVAFIRSKGSKSKAIARTLMLPPQWRFILTPSVIYIVEVLSEKYDNLGCEEKAYVILHELTHIPTKMKGGLRNHNHPDFKKLKKKDYNDFSEICKQI